MPSGKSNRKFLVVAVDYFTKRVEAEAMAAITPQTQSVSSGDQLFVDSEYHTFLWQITRRSLTANSFESGASRLASKPLCDPLELGSSLRWKDCKTLVPRVEETSGTKPRKLIEPFLVLVSGAGLFGGVLLTLEAAKGIACFFFFWGTSSGLTVVGSKGLFLVACLRDWEASPFFLIAPLLVTVFLFSRIVYSRNCLMFRRLPVCWSPSPRTFFLLLSHRTNHTSF